ncbi:hypothetical protein [Parachitinimonas caeni]|uniref:Barstar (barnase inhibitor) domain-containing protein n=1 Tax=Parachitinimonas caeni TaxID=3031301 RepID=A0ABT7DWC9_9NEIS|nr:hypothetical protein [Parachitinimonas caeni]MDK2124357.1 hypothetical protein [Parachitinimonas caeni]
MSQGKYDTKRKKQYSEHLLFSGIQAKEPLRIPAGICLQAEFIWGGEKPKHGPLHDLYPKQDISIDINTHSIAGFFDISDYIDEARLCFAEALEFGNLVEWREITSREERKSWLLACMDQHGSYYFQPRNQESGIDIDGMEVRDDMDFYCLLGEKIFGKYGYCGIGLDAVSDCMGGIIDGLNGGKIRIRHCQLLRERIDKYENKFSVSKILLDDILGHYIEVISP